MRHDVDDEDDVHNEETDDKDDALEMTIMNISDSPTMQANRWFSAKTALHREDADDGHVQQWFGTQRFQFQCSG